MIAPFRNLALALALAAAMLAAALPAPAAPRRIVSLNLCADQYLVALADRGQIAALTDLARDPAMSFVARQAAALPVTTGDAEQVLALDPDLVIAAPGLHVTTMALLAERKVPGIALPPAESYAAIVAQVREIARAIGHPDRGEALIRRMDAQLAAIVPVGGHPVAAYYQRRGFLTGTGTLVDEMMARVGLTNLAGKLGRPILSRLSLEQMVVARPDWMIVENATDRVTDRGSEMLHHPALAAIPRLRLPEAWTVCGGPSFPIAVRNLAAQLRAARHRAGS